MRTTGGGDRGAKAARDQVATASADGADKSQRGGGLEAGRLQGERPGNLAQAFRVPALLLAKDRRNHSIGRAVADPRGDEKNQKRRQKAGKVLDVHEVHHADRRGAHGDEVPERHDRAADLVGEQSAKRTRERTHQRSQEGNSHRDLRELGLYQQRKRRGVADKGAERSDIDVGHHPRVLALDDDELVFERRARRGEVVHEEERAGRREHQRQQPHQPRVLKIKTVRDRGCLVKTYKAESQQQRGEQLHATHSDISTSRVQAERPALHAVRVEERNIGHARGEVAASEACRCRDQQHQPERRVGLSHEIGECERWNE